MGEKEIIRMLKKDNLMIFDYGGIGEKQKGDTGICGRGLLETNIILWISTLGGFAPGSEGTYFRLDGIKDGISTSLRLVESSYFFLRLGFSLSRREVNLALNRALQKLTKKH